MFRNLKTKFFFVLISLFLCFYSLRIYAGESSISVDKIMVDYANHRLVISDTVNSMYYLGVARKDGGEPKEYNAYVTQGDKTMIDLSTFSGDKVWELLLHGDKDTLDQRIMINANLKKLKASYNPVAASIEQMIQIFNNGTMLELEDIEWRTQNGDWNAGDRLSLSRIDSFTVLGTTLFFRERAAIPATLAAVGTTVGRPHSVEAELKIPKKKKAPAVTIDYAKMTIKFPKNAEYRLAHSGEWQSISGTVSVSFFYQSWYAMTLNDLYLEVRDKATEKIAASKINMMTISKQPTISLAVTSNVEIIDTIKGNKGTTKMELKNGSNEDIEYFISPTSNPSVDLTTQKWSKLAKGKSVSLNKKKANRSYIVYRVAAKKGVSLPSTTATTRWIYWTEASK